MQSQLLSVKDRGLSLVSESRYRVPCKGGPLPPLWWLLWIVAVARFGDTSVDVRVRASVGREMMPRVKARQLSIPTLEHGQHMLQTPFVHPYGPDQRHVHAEGTVMSAALQAQQGSVTHGGPLWVTAATIDAPMVAIHPPEQGKTRRGEGPVRSVPVPDVLLVW